MTEILTRVLRSTLHVRDDGEGRTLHGPLLPWGVEARVLDRGRLVVETFERGALAGTDPGRITLTATHPRDAGTLPIGRTLAIEERDDAAWGEWLVSDTMIGNEVLALARDGVPLGLSVGFAEVPGGSRWSPDRSRGDPDQSGTRPRGRGPRARLRRGRGGGRPLRGVQTPRPGTAHPGQTPWLRAAGSTSATHKADAEAASACSSDQATAASPASRSSANASAASHDDPHPAPPLPRLPPQRQRQATLHRLPTRQGPSQASEAPRPRRPRRTGTQTPPRRRPPRHHRGLVPRPRPAPRPPLGRPGS
jgi:hypothetical protein